MAGLRKRRPGLVYPIREDWHYVGETGEPAFNSTWDNVSVDKYNLAFRIRETGVVDVQGLVLDGGAGPGLVFTLPAGYRPSNRTYSTLQVHAAAPYYAPGWVVIDPDGTVTFDWDSAITPISMMISGQFFLVPPSAP